DPRLRPRHQAADVRELRLDGDPEIAGRRVVCDDAVGVGALREVRGTSGQVLQRETREQEEHALVLLHFLLELPELLVGGGLPRRSASASRWRSTASSPPARDTASRVSCTDTFASTTASRI